MVICQKQCKGICRELIDGYADYCCDHIAPILCQGLLSSQRRGKRNGGNESVASGSPGP